LVADLLQRQVEVIVVENTVAAREIKRTTSSLPIVMAIVADPVGSGLVASLAHPGANFTGLSLMLRELSAKRLQILKEALPHVARVAVLWNPTVPWHAKVIEDLKVAAPSLSLTLTFVSVRTPDGIGPALSAVKGARAQALYVVEDPIFQVHRATLLDLATNARLPTIHGNRRYVDAGGLISYGADYGDLFRRSAWYVDKILKGVKPSDLPIEQPTKFDLVVNLRTAKVLGIALPESILLRADEVIR